MSTVLTEGQELKARRLLYQRGCLACHAVGAKGGRIGPDLADVRERLKPAYVDSIVADPSHAAPWSIMPGAQLDATSLDLLTRFLVGNRMTPPARGHLDLTRNPIVLPTRAIDARELYRRACAACHGADGRGTGYNAAYLTVRPASHADAGAMGRRTDAELFRAISDGGAAVGRSPLMPAFGQRLDSVQTRSLVRYIRTLCGCRGPAAASPAPGTARPPTE